VTFTEIFQLVTAITALSSAIASLISAVASSRNARKIQEVHLLINSRMNELLKTTENASYALGVKDEANRKNSKR